MDKRRFFYYAFLCAMVACGVLLIWMSTFSEAFESKDLLNAMGGAVLGTSGSVLIASLLGHSEFKDLQSSIEKFAQVILSKHTLTSEVDLVRPMSGRWYCYTVSQRKGETLWRMVSYDLDVDGLSGEIKFRGEFRDNVGKVKTWDYVGMRRDERFIVIGRSAEDFHASCVVQVFPNFGNITQQHYSGITFHRTWDGVNSISPTFISRNPINQFKTDSLANEQMSIKLDELWEFGFRARNDLILPRVFDLRTRPRA